MKNRNIFYRNKNNYAVLLWIVPVLAVLLIFGMWINAGDDDESVLEGQGNSDVAVSTGSPAISGGNFGEDDKNMPGSNNEVLDGQSGAYYLLKEIDGTIKLFYYDERGNETLVAETNIAYLLISEKDQKAFEKGIVIRSPEELNELLQDFES